MIFEAKNIKAGYANHVVLKDISMSLETGEILCVLGANGAGKSTFFKAILGLIPLTEGSITIDGENMMRWSRKKISQVIGYIPQFSNPPFSYTVLDMVLMGRTAHLKAMGLPDRLDRERVIKIMEELEIEKLISKKFLRLSGGEKQLVMIARALAQEPKILVMDEPTSALDYGNQQMVLNQVYKLKKRGLGIVMASHYPDHAFLYGDQVLLFKEGLVYQKGAPDEVITPKNLKEIYGVDASIFNTKRIKESLNREIKVCVPLE